MLDLADPLLEHEHFWILNDESPVLPAGERYYTIAHAERDLRVLKNYAECSAILSREQPDVLISCGAGPAVPAFHVGGWMRIPGVFIEPSSAVTELTLTGRLLLKRAARFYVQWPGLAERFPIARYVGGLQ